MKSGKQMDNDSILLDTHVLIWLINGDTKLSTKALKLINKAATLNSIFVSAISIWEIGMLEAKGKIILNRPVSDWVAAALEAPGIKLAPLTPKIAIESCHLHEFHGDPADRIIVATGRVEELTLITKDRKILQYGKKHQINAVEA